jgi:hypothetical protein
MDGAAIEDGSVLFFYQTCKLPSPSCFPGGGYRSRATIHA